MYENQSFDANWRANEENEKLKIGYGNSILIMNIYLP